MPGFEYGLPEDQGLLTTTALGDPAAGADYANVSIQANTRAKIIGFDGTLVTSVTGGSRKLTIRYNDGANIFTRAAMGTIHLASTTVTYSGALGGGHAYTNEFSATGGSVIPFPLLDIVVQGSDVISFNTLNLAAGDNWGPGFLRLMFWHQPS